MAAVRLAMRYGFRTADDFLSVIGADEFMELWAAMHFEDVLMRPELATTRQEETGGAELTAKAAEAKAKAMYG